MERNAVHGEGGGDGGVSRGRERGVDDFLTISTLHINDAKKLQQVNLDKQLTSSHLHIITSSDFGVSTGLINQRYREMSKWYYVKVERGHFADKSQPRNINVSFSNNSCS